MQRSSVLLPDPERPMMAMISPSPMATDTSSSTVTGPKRLVTFRISTSGMESPFEHPAPVRQRKAHQEVEQRHRAVDGEGLEGGGRSEEHTSELQSLMRISYAVFCLKKKKHKNMRNSYKKTTNTIN